MLIQRIAIRGFKSIREAELDLRPLSVLIGANGAGKSNFVAVFELLRKIVERRLQDYVAEEGGPDALLRHGQKSTAELHVAVSFESGSGYEATLKAAKSNSLYIADEAWGAGTNGITGGATQETELHEWLPTLPEVSRPVIHALESLHLYHFEDTSRSARLKGLGDLGDNGALRDDASNLAAFLYLLQHKHPEHYRRIVSTVRLAAPFFEGFRLRPSPANEQKIQLEWNERGSDAYFNAHALSDGTLRFICLATLLLQPAPPAIVIIDEPEIGLHPYAITLLAGLLRGAATTTQVIVSTQSVTLVNQLQPEDIVVVDRKAGESAFRRLAAEETSDWLEEYGLGDLWEKNVIGGRPSAQ